MPPPTAYLDPSCLWQPDINVAAATALLHADDANRYREFSGAIYRNAKGEFCYSLPVKGKVDTFAFATDPTAGKLSGIYHTHPGEFAPSQDDIAMADKLNVPSYIRSRYGAMAVYRPGGNKRGEQLARALIDALMKKQGAK